MDSCAHLVFIRARPQPHVLPSSIRWCGPSCSCFSHRAIFHGHHLRLPIYRPVPRSILFKHGEGTEQLFDFRLFADSSQKSPQPLARSPSTSSTSIHATRVKRSLIHARSQPHQVRHHPSVPFAIHCPIDACLLVSKKRCAPWCYFSTIVCCYDWLFDSTSRAITVVAESHCSYCRDVSGSSLLHA